METTTNLKRRRDSRETKAKKHPYRNNSQHLMSQKRHPPAQSSRPAFLSPHHKNPNKNNPNKPLQQSLQPEIPFSPNLPSLSPLMMFSRSRSMNRLPIDNPDHIQKQIPSLPNPDSQKRQRRTLSFVLCGSWRTSCGLSTPQSSQAKWTLRMFLIHTCSGGAPIAATFVRSAGNRTKGVWRLLDMASRAETKLAEMEHPSLR